MNVTYVIKAESGAYSDQEHWIVCVYTTREQADAHVKAFDEYMKGLPEQMSYVDYGKSGFEERWRENVRLRNEYCNANLYCRPCSEDTSLEVIETLEVRHLDEFMEQNDEFLQSQKLGQSSDSGQEEMHEQENVD